MISLPSKPWKKVRIEAADQRYRIVLLTEMPTEAEFLNVIKDDIVPCLSPRDELSSPNWPSRSVTLTTLDLPTFKRNLIFASVMVELE